MTDPSNFVNQHADRWTIPESMVEHEKKIAALEQRFNALSTKFSAMVEENATLKRERDELKEENETLRCHAHDAELAFERNAELKAENATLRKRLEPIEEWWDRNCSEYIRKKHQKWDASMYEAIEKAMELKEGE